MVIDEMSIKSGKKSGQPTKLTPKLQKKFCDLVAEGNYYQPICGYCGITYACFREWMTRGEQDKNTNQVTIYSKFFDAVACSNTIAEVNAVQAWQKCLNNPEHPDWKAARDFLARRYPDRWSSKEERKCSGYLDINFSKLSDEELNKIAESELSNDELRQLYDEK